MSLTREQTLNQLHAWTATESLRKHCRAVEIVMRAAAKKYGDVDADVEIWGITGLIHDADYEQWPEEHPQRIVDWLKEQGQEEIAYAVAFHQTKWNLPAHSTMDKALVACDEMAGFVMACCLVRPDGIHSLTPQSVVKKLKNLPFAAKVDRQIIRDGVALLGVDLNDHIQFVIDSLKPQAEELGIGGSGKG